MTVYRDSGGGCAHTAFLQILPVVESFELATELRKKTSGGASAVLVPDGYSVIDEDPFWVPSTEEEVSVYVCYDSVVIVVVLQC